MAVTGRQNIYVYFASQHAITALVTAAMPMASKRAAVNRSIEPARLRILAVHSAVAARTRFLGWVHTPLYAQVLDLFLDSFPFPCGLTLSEAMAAGKPVVLFESPESLETGLAGAISPVREGTARVSTSDRARIAEIFTARQPFDLYCCARTPAEYEALASRLIEDPRFRADAGKANQTFIERFLSDPQSEGSKLVSHLEDILATTPRTTV